MAALDIELKGGDEYLFTAEGCHLKYFVIWAEGDEKQNWELVKGDGYYYQMTYHLDKNKTYYFHAYDGEFPEYFRGKMKYKT